AVPDDERDARWAQNSGIEIRAHFATTADFVSYTACQKAINRSVLLKRSKGGPRSPQHEDLRREAQVLAAIDHPNVLRLHEWGERSGQVYLVTELAEGAAPLSQCIGGQPLAPPRAAGNALRAALGGQALHDAGFVPGGLTPNDIVLFPRHRPKVGNLAGTPPR